MQPDGSHYKQAHLGTTHQGTGRQEGCEGFSQTHFIRQNGTATGQEPTGSGALMAQGATTILKGFVEIR
jgi:hypothetical protein